MKSGSFPRRGEIYWCRFDPSEGTEMKKTRPCVILSHDAGNEWSNQVIVAPITSSAKNVRSFEVRVIIKEKLGKIVIQQLRCVDKIRLGKKIDTLNSITIYKIDVALKLILGLS